MGREVRTGGKPMEGKARKERVGRGVWSGRPKTGLPVRFVGA